MKVVLYYQRLLYILKVICVELINKHYNNLFAGHFGIEKTQKLIVKKYYQPTLQKDVKIYIKGFNMYLASKVVYYKLYKDL